MLGKVINNKGRKGYATSHFCTRISWKKGAIAFPAAAPGAFRIFWDRNSHGEGGGVADMTDTIHHKHHGSMNNSNVYFYYFFQAVKMR